MDSWLKTGSLLERKKKSENNKNPLNKIKKIMILFYQKYLKPPIM